MTFLALPLIPFTVAGALFIKNRYIAYSIPILLVLIKMVFTQITPIYLFMGASLLLAVAVIRALQAGKKAGILQAAGYAVIATVSFELISNLGFWIIGCCSANEGRMVDFNLQGLKDTFQAALPYAGFHLLKSMTLSIALVAAISWLEKKSVAIKLAKQAA